MFFFASSCTRIATLVILVIGADVDVATNIDKVIIKEINDVIGQCS